MSIPEVIEFILLPAVGWLLINSNKSQKRLTRIEVTLEFLAERYGYKKHKNKTEEDTDI